MQEDSILTEKLNLDFISLAKRFPEESEDLNSVPELFIRIFTNTTIDTYSLCTYPCSQACSHSSNSFLATV